jgi:hypothetical protein
VWITDGAEGGLPSEGECKSASPKAVQAKKLVLYAPLYDNPLHTSLSVNSGLQNQL